MLTSFHGSPVATPYLKMLSCSAAFSAAHTIVGVELPPAEGAIRMHARPPSRRGYGIGIRASSQRTGSATGPPFAEQRPSHFSTWSWSTKTPVSSSLHVGGWSAAAMMHGLEAAAEGTREKIDQKKKKTREKKSGAAEGVQLHNWRRVSVCRLFLFFSFLLFLLLIILVAPFHPFGTVPTSD